MKKFVATIAGVILGGFSVSTLLPSNAVASSRPRVIEQRLAGAGSVTLDTSLYLPTQLSQESPAAKKSSPAILLAHGFAGDKSSVAPEARFLAAQGYVVLTWTARGFGKSTGEISMNAPDGEVADVSRLIDYLSTRSDVIQQSKGDPLVGIAGDSYGGAVSLLAAGYDHRIDALAANITWSNLRQDLFPQYSNDPSYGPYKKFWAGTFFALASLPNAFGGECGTFRADWCRAFKDAVATGVPTAADEKLLLASSPSTIASQITAPTLLMQGEADSLFPLRDSIENAKAIHEGHPDLPISMIWHSGGHDGGTDESKRLMQARKQWFDKYLLHQKINFPKFQVTDTNGSISLIDSSVIPKFLESNSLPTSMTRSSLRISTPFTALIAPIGGIPGAISSLPGVGSALALAGNIGGISAAFLPGQSGFLETQPLEHPISLVGPSEVKVKVSSNKSDAVLFFSLVVRTASGQTKQPNGIVAPVHLTNVAPAGSLFTIELPAVVVDAAAGDKLAVAISTTDQGYALPPDGRLYTVTVAGPLMISDSIFTSSKSSSSLAIWPIAALIFVGLSLWMVHIRRPRHNAERITSDGSNNPADSGNDGDSLVTVNSLSKVYKDGYKAVDDLSFSVKRGQVLGLLGPNGAGKTTTLRMLMGLIYPTEGEICINGKPIYPGSPTLAELGSFVEGSGFLPHLSGRENLDLYWKSIGRSDEPFFDEAIRITDLGRALDKKVRSYSQGMRQRLAIAQAMLGMPDLLVLDEPTNGLDPQQIKAMRDVLKNYAKTGRTVIVSSHLLSEVEQTCSHVVLMHRGKLIAFGTLKKILNMTGKKKGSLEEIFIELIGDDLTIGKEA